MERFKLKNLLDIKSYSASNIFLAFTVLRFVATCLITNTHYNEVYPIPALAVGGLLGDVFFFIVSGFVLARPIKESFLCWYGKRILRIYPAIIIGVLIYWITGYSDFEAERLFQTLVFPTAFVFVGAIITLYIPYYFVNKIETKRVYAAVFGGVLLSWLAAYAFLDKSAYVMNAVTNPMILFPYFIAMLIGGYLRKFAVKKHGKLQITLLSLASITLLMGYFVSNNIIRSSNMFNMIQIVVPISLLVASATVATLFYVLEDWFRKWPKGLLNVINFIAALTLEIYVVQRPIIDFMASIVFPLNWVLITVSIIAAAVLVRLIINIIKEALSLLILSIKSKN